MSAPNRQNAFARFALVVPSSKRMLRREFEAYYLEQTGRKATSKDWKRFYKTQRREETAMHRARQAQAVTP